MAQDDDLERLMGHLGGFGKFQCYQFLLHVLSGFCAGLHMITLVTVAAVPRHRCMITSLENNTWHMDYDNISILEQYIPMKDDGTWDSCSVISEDNATERCSSWVYDTTYYSSSRGMEWDFVCDRRWMGAISKSAYIFGVFMGAVSLGTLADKYGRKTIFCISAVMQLILGVGVAFVNEFYSFLIMSFMYGIFGSAGAYITGFVLSMELVGASYRTACGIAFQAMFAFGMMIVAFWGSFITDYTLLQVIYGLHSLLLLPHYWLMTESPRWLWSQGKIAESVDIVCRGVEMNGYEVPDKAFFISRGKATQHRKDQETKSYGILDMFKTPRLRLITLNVCLNWFANSLGYYGLSLNTDKLFSPDMNPFLALFIMGLVEVPSYIMIVLILDRTGRRCLTATLMIIGGIACLSTPFIPTLSSLGSVTAILVVFVGKFCIAGSFAIIYNYSAELFPTVVRNTALGLGSMCARFSATLTPLITLLDSFDKRIPTLVFATVTLVAGITTLFLPETLNKNMPQSLEDGENFGRGDTCFSTGCFGSRSRRESVPMDSV